jgi:hypothetical protein
MFFQLILRVPSKRKITGCLKSLRDCPESASYLGGITFQRQRIIPGAVGGDGANRRAGAALVLWRLDLVRLSQPRR